MGRFGYSTSEKVESARKVISASLHLARKKLYDRGLRSGIFASFHDVYDADYRQAKLEVVGSVKVVWNVKVYHETLIPPFLAVPLNPGTEILERCMPYCGDWRAITDSHRMILINTNAIWSSVECEAIKCEVNLARPKQKDLPRFAAFLGNGPHGDTIAQSSFAYSDDPRFLSSVIQKACLVHIGAFPNVLPTQQREILFRARLTSAFDVPHTSVNSFWISQAEGNPPTVQKERFAHYTTNIKSDVVYLPPNFSFDELWSEI